MNAGINMQNLGLANGPPEPHHVMEPPIADNGTEYFDASEPIIDVAGTSDGPLDGGENQPQRQPVQGQHFHFEGRGTIYSDGTFGFNNDQGTFRSQQQYAPQSATPTTEILRRFLGNSFMEFFGVLFIVLSVLLTTGIFLNTFGIINIPQLSSLNSLDNSADFKVLRQEIKTGLAQLHSPVTMYDGYPMKNNVYSEVKSLPTKAYSTTSYAPTPASHDKFVNQAAAGSDQENEYDSLDSYTEMLINGLDHVSEHLTANEVAVEAISKEFTNVQEGYEQVINVLKESTDDENDLKKSLAIFQLYLKVRDLAVNTLHFTVPYTKFSEEINRLLQIVPKIMNAAED